MFDKLLNEKNRYILFNLLFSLILIGVFLLLIAILNDSALYKEICINANAKSKKLDYSKIALQYEECLCYAIGEYK